MEGLENREHTFQDCIVTKGTWNYLSVTWPDNISHAEFTDWFTWIVLTSNTEDCQKFICAIWAIWSARKKWVHEGQKQSGKEVAKFILQYLQELKDIKQTQVTSKPSNNNWRPPGKCYYKINFDVAVDLKTNKSCLGIIVRDYKGNEVATRSTLHENIPLGFEAEAIACLQAVILGRDLGLKFVDIEKDSLTVIKKAKSTKRAKSVIGSYIQDIKELSKFFYKINFQHIGRSTNEKVHNLASKGLKIGENAYLDRRSADQEITEVEIDRGWRCRI
ncbi:hypothetical protein PVK06_022721 [Gossypium arboreum]|uniref:RNase H type-1 domain-containing protein n=1 Tax=Gossypium arboreum TaxID=29729 RepID=A0ABR0P9A4_GOSAR|nr:hypothetical protein PVK06_022721 [Gossypium arboreum]